MKRSAFLMAAALAINGLVINGARAADPTTPANPAPGQTDNQLNHAQNDANQTTNNAGAAVNNGADAARNAANSTGNTADNAGDKIRNSLEHAGAGTPSAQNPAPDAKSIRNTLADLTDDALTKGDMRHLIGYFVDADRDRIKNGAGYDQNYGDKLDGRIEQINQIWKQKYGHEFKIRDANEALSDQFATIQQGQIGHDPELASYVMQNSGQAVGDAANTGNGNNAANTGTNASEQKLENGRSIAVVEVKASSAQGAGQQLNGQQPVGQQPAGQQQLGQLQTSQQLRVPLIHELPDSWRLNVPDSMDANKLRQNLLDHLTAVGDMSKNWPTDEKEAQRIVTQHVLMAVLDKPVANNGDNAGATQNPAAR